MTEIYIGGRFSIETTTELTAEQVDELYHRLDCLPIYVTLPADIASLLNVKPDQSDWIDEVEILN